MEETIEGLGNIKLSGARQFELYGAFLMYGGTKQRTLFLLSDYLLVCQKQKLVCDCGGGGGGGGGGVKKKKMRKK